MLGFQKMNALRVEHEREAEQARAQLVQANQGLFHAEQQANFQANERSTSKTRLKAELANIFAGISCRKVTLC